MESQIRRRKVLSKIELVVEFACTEFGFGSHLFLLNGNEFHFIIEFLLLNSDFAYFH